MESAKPRDNYFFESKKIMFIFGYSYKALLDIHLLNMSKHSLGWNSGAVCPPP